jgi:hypothetical protein
MATLAETMKEIEQKTGYVERSRSAPSRSTRAGTTASAFASSRTTRTTAYSRAMRAI